MARRFSGDKLVELRGLTTQTDLANQLRQQGYGTTQTTVSRWENGQEPRRYMLKPLAVALGCDIDDLFENVSSVEEPGESHPFRHTAA